MQDPTNGWVDPSYELTGPELAAFVTWIKEEGEDRSGAGVPGDIKPLQQLDYTHGPSVQQSQGIRVLLSDAEAPEGVRELGLVDALLQITGDSELKDLKNELDQDIYILIENHLLELSIYELSLKIDLEFYVSTFEFNFNFPSVSFSDMEGKEDKFDAIEEADGTIVTFSIEGFRKANQASVYLNGVFDGVTSSASYTFTEAPLTNSTIEFVGHFTDPSRTLDTYIKQSMKGSAEMEKAAAELGDLKSQKEVEMEEAKRDKDKAEADKAEAKSNKEEAAEASRKCREELENADSIADAEKSGKCVIENEKDVLVYAKSISTSESEINKLEIDIATRTKEMGDINDVIAEVAQSYEEPKQRANEAIQTIKTDVESMPDGATKEALLAQVVKAEDAWSVYAS